MRGINLKPSRVHQVATRLLESQCRYQEPPWYKIIGEVPPGEFLTRTQPVEHRMPKVHSRTRKPSKMFKPQIIDYEEDKLRREFYADHPWELARPRIVLENDGKDGQRCDWSKLEQVGRPLDGESVVQRQLWLMNNDPGISKNEAYDKARKEFYALRHAEEIERKVAREEALWAGATFGPGPLEWGIHLEDKMYASWRAWSIKNIETAELHAEAGVYHDIEDAEETEEKITEEKTAGISPV